MRRVSRRELVQMVAGAGAASTARALPLGAQPAVPSGYIGPLTGVMSGVDDHRFDPVAYTRDRYGAAPRRMRFQARTRAQAESWTTLRAKVIELIGGFPSERQSLPPVTLETRAFAGYRREKIVFDSRPGVSVLAYLLPPTDTRTPALRRPRVHVG
jgi:hypothetical protein